MPATSVFNSFSISAHLPFLFFLFALISCYYLLSLFYLAENVTWHPFLFHLTFFPWVDFFCYWVCFSVQKCISKSIFNGCLVDINVFWWSFLRQHLGCSWKLVLVITYTQMKPFLSAFSSFLPAFVFRSSMIIIISCDLLWYLPFSHVFWNLSISSLVLYQMTSLSLSLQKISVWQLAISQHILLFI